MNPATPAPWGPPATALVVVSAYFPPVVGGTSTVVRNLVGALRPEAVRVVSEIPTFLYGRHNDEPPPGVAVRRLGLPGWLRRLPFGRIWVRVARYQMIPRLRRAILAEAQAVKARRIVALYPSWPFLIAAAQAARAAELPLITYHMDAMTPPALAPWPDRQHIVRWEEPILRQAACRMVLTEALAEDLHQRYGLDSVVVRHSVVPSPAAPAQAERPPGPLHLVHTGVVEQLQYEGLLRLVKALESAADIPAKLTLCTPNNPADLAACGLARPMVAMVTLPTPEVRALQRQADVLIAVLPFFGRVKALDLTAFPTKVTEYLESGTPILAHAPKESFFARHARQHGYAMVVDEPTEAALLAALRRLQAEPALRAQLLAAAGRTLADLFARPKVARVFAAAAQLDTRILDEGRASRDEGAKPRNARNA